MDEHVVKLTFPSKETLDVFWGWFLDGGGDQGLDASLEDCGLAVSYTWDQKAGTVTFSPRSED